MTKIIFIDHKIILKIKSGLYDYLHQAIVQIIEESELALSPQLNKFIELLDYYDLDVTKYLTSQEDILLFASLIKQALELREKEGMPFDAIAKSFFLICHYELLIYAATLNTELQDPSVITFTCQDRGTIKNVVSFPESLCEQFFRCMKNLIHRSFFTPESVKNIIAEITPPYKQTRTVMISAHVTTQHDLLFFIDLVSKAVPTLDKAQPALTELEKIRLLLFYHWLIYYDHNLEFYDATGKQRNTPYHRDTKTYGNKTINSIAVSLAAQSCIEQKLVQWLDRVTDPEEEFLDPFDGQAWDCQLPRSHSVPDNKYIFDAHKCVKELQKKLRNNSKVIFALTEIGIQDQETLFEEIRKQVTREELSRMIIVDSDNPTLSMKDSTLINFFTGEQQ